MEKFIVVDTETNKIMLSDTTCHNALMYAEFLNDYGKSKRYECIHRNDYVKKIK